MTQDGGWQLLNRTRIQHLDDLLLSVGISASGRAITATLYVSPDGDGTDGLTWEKQYYIDPDPGIDANHVPQALVCEREGKQWLYLFYTIQVGWRWEEGKYPFFKENAAGSSQLLLDTTIRAL